MALAIRLKYISSNKFQTHSLVQQILPQISQIILTVASTSFSEVLIKKLLVYLIYMEIPVRSRFGQIVNKTRCCQSSLEITFKSQSHLLINGPESLKLESEVGLKNWNTNYVWKIFIRKTRLPCKIFLCSPQFCTSCLFTIHR